jgi:hypothetical protein
MNKHSQYCSSGDMTLEAIHMAVCRGGGEEGQARKNEGEGRKKGKGGLGEGRTGRRKCEEEGGGSGGNRE